MSLSPASVPREHWRHLLRSLLRECTYLPDPIAKCYMHDYVVDRFRRYSGPDRTLVEGYAPGIVIEQFHRHSSKPGQVKWDINKQHQLRKAAKQKLTLLRRANEGYSKALDQVLRLSYGRTGKRRKDLVDRFVTPEVPADSLGVAELLKQPSMFEDGWTPPPLVVSLVKSQQTHGVIQELGVRPNIKGSEPKIPAENIWGRPLSRSRRRNIRKNWYNTVLDGLYPPLPEGELNKLQDLISGVEHWEPPKRRKAVGPPPVESTAALDTKFLVDGPAKGSTFREYVDGRPHKITRRFMRRLWQRIVCLVPRMWWHEGAQKYIFLWQPMKKPVPMSVPVDSELSDMFSTVDSKGRAIASPSAKG